MVLPFGQTGLPSIDMSFVGNAVGETGNSPTDTYVNGADVDGCAANPAGFTLDDFLVLKTNFGNSGVGFAGGDYDRSGTVNLDDFVILKRAFGTQAAIDDPYDFNRDGRVAGEDLDIAESNPTGAGDCLTLLSP